MSVSVVTTVTSVLTLATATAAFGIAAWIANVIATTVATIPSYYLNRRWTWGRTGASDPWRSCARHTTSFSTSTSRVRDHHRSDCGHGALKTSVLCWTMA
jgi:putative flippase GtrA